MSRALSLLLVLLAVSSAFGQQSVAEAAAQSRAAADAKKAAAEPPSREQVLKLFDVMQITQSIDTMISASKQQSMDMADQMISERMPNMTQQQKQQFHGMVEDVMREALGPEALKEMLAATVPVYQKHLTKGDLDAMMAFYSSPVGQKILHEQPAMVKESMEASANIQQRIARTMYQKIDERVEEMVEQNKGQNKK
jgi:hypothetical protein